jgi:hypothetical protein
MEERLAFILPYLKLNPLREAQADMFGIEQKQCCELIYGLLEILHRSLSLAGREGRGTSGSSLRRVSKRRLNSSA